MPPASSAVCQYLPTATSCAQPDGWQMSYGAIVTWLVAQDAASFWWTVGGGLALLVAVAIVARLVAALILNEH